MIRTVLGDIPAGCLGHTQCHEHLFIAKGKPFAVNPALYMDSLPAGEAELRAYAGAGGGALVDAQPVFCGRMPRALRAAAQHTGVPILAVTGAHKLAFYPETAPVFTLSEDALYRLFRDEVQTGMLDAAGVPTGIRAGLVKIALDAPGAGQSPVYGKLYRAAAAAAKETGAALMVHTEAGADVLGAVRWLEGQGVPPRRLILCHLERAWNDLVYHREALESGAYLCYDSVNRPQYLSQARELAFFQQAVGLGRGGQVLLGLDTTRARLRAYGADMGLDFILTTFLPALRQAGISQESIGAFTRKNPARALKMEPTA